jgi:hypothetical protein
MSSICDDSCSSDASRTSTTSSEVEIHISEAFQDIEPPYIGEDFVASSPVPSSWKAESPSNAPTAWIPHLMANNPDPALPATPTSQRFPPAADNVFRVSNTRTSTTLDREEENEKWISTAGFIRPFEYNEWEGWDGESGIYTTDESLGGYGGGDEESRISHYVDPIRFGQAGSLVIGTRVSTQLQGGSRRGTITSIKSSERLGTFDFDALPALPVFQGAASSPITPAVHGRPRYRTREASPPPLDGETSLTEADRRGGALRTWLVEVPKAFIRRTQGRCGASKEVMNDVLSRSAEEASKRNGDAYRDDIPTTEVGQLRSTRSNSIAINNTTSKEKGKERLDVKREKEGWRTRWNRVLSVPAFKSPLTKILSPVVTRAQWEIVVRSGILAFLISCVVVGILVAVPVP